MATRFELVLHGDDPVALRAAGEEALDEIDRLENRLSLYRPGSEIAQINSRAARERVCVSREVFDLLQFAQRLHAATGGAFDITVAPLVRCWGFMGANGRMPTSVELTDARACVGMQKVQLDTEFRSVRFARQGVMLDLGAIGKGYAVEQAAGILRSAGVTSALIHGGTSTVCAIGHPPDATSWEIAIEQPQGGSCLRVNWPEPIPLLDEAMSVSAVWGRSFIADGKLLGHVIDPRTGQPVGGALLAAVVLASATETDALSTALLVLGSERRDSLASWQPRMRALVLTDDGREIRFEPKIVPNIDRFR